ncbi:MAG: GumC family protein, partial [bacterium]
MENGKEDIIRLPGGQSISSTAQRYQDLNTEIQLLKSDEMTKRVQALENGANLGSLVVWPVEEGTNVLGIGFEDPDPERAARMVNHVIKAYADFRSQSFYKATDADSFLRKQIDVNLDTLDRLRKRLDRFRAREQIIELSQQKGQLLAQFNELETKLFEFTRQRASETSRLNEFRALWKDRNEEDPVPSGFGGVNWGQVSTLQQQLSDLRLRRATLLEKYTPEYDEVVNVDESMAIIQKMLREKINQLKALEEAAILSRLRVLQVDEEIVRGKLEELRVKLKDIPEIEEHYTNLSR